MQQNLSNTIMVPIKLWYHSETNHVDKEKGTGYFKHTCDESSKKKIVTAFHTGNEKTMEVSYTVSY